MQVSTTRTYFLERPGAVGHIAIPGTAGESTVVNDGRVDSAILSNPRIGGIAEARQILKLPQIRQAMADLVMEPSSADYSEARDCALRGEQSSGFSNVLDHAWLQQPGPRHVQLPGPNGEEKWFVALEERDRCRSFRLGPCYGNQQIEFFGAALTLKTQVPTVSGVLRQHIVSDWDAPNECAADPKELFILESSN